MSRIVGLYDKIKKAITWRIMAQYEFYSAYFARCQFDWFVRPKLDRVSHLDGAALIFAPHQDDETLGCGGLIALKRQQDIPVSVAFLTDGSACYESIALPGVTVMPTSEIIQLRKEEATEALEKLGVNASNIHFLDQRDQFLGSQTQHDRNALIDRLVTLIETVSPQDIYVTYRYDVHEDHQQTYQVVYDAIIRSQRSVRLWEYPVWSFWSPRRLSGLARDERSRLYRLPINTVLSQKQAALNCYRSQYQQRSGTICPVLSANFMQYLSSISSEVFVMREF